MGMNDSWNTKSRFVGEVHALSFRGSPVGEVHPLFFHGSPARVPLLLQAARGRHAQLQARGVDDLGPGAIQAEIPFERVDDVVERRRRARGLGGRLPNPHGRGSARVATTRQPAVALDNHAVDRYRRCLAGSRRALRAYGLHCQGQLQRCALTRQSISSFFCGAPPEALPFPRDPSIGLGQR